MSNMIKLPEKRKSVWDDIASAKYEYRFFKGLDSKTGEITFEKQIGLIQSEYYKALGSEETTVLKTMGIRSLLGYFQSKKLQAEATEAELFRVCNKNNSMSYLMTDNEKIKAWTNLFILGSANKTQWNMSDFNDRKRAFGLYINSTNFIQAYRGKVASSTLSMTKYAQALGQDTKKEGWNKENVQKEFVGMILNPQKQAYRDLYHSVLNSMRDYFYSGPVEEVITEQLRRQISTAFSATRDTIKVLQSSSKKSESGQYEEIKKKLKMELEKVMNKELEKKSQEWKDAKINKKGMLESIKIGFTPEGKLKPVVFLTIEAESGASGTYKRNNDMTPEEKRNAFITAVRETWREYGHFSDKEFKAGMFKFNPDENPGFWECVKEFINQDLERITKIIFYDNSTFFTQDWNSSVMTGMLGELATFLFSSNNLEDLKLTGTIRDTKMIGGTEIGLGEGYRDLTFGFNGKEYGINVKRYTTQEASDFTLYGDEESIGVGSQYMYRYFSEDQVKLMRFIAMNRKFIEEEIAGNYQQIDHSIQESFTQMSAENIDKFIRLSSAANEDSINLFYMINNLVIPASVIYSTLEEAVSNTQTIKDSFDILGINRTPNYEEEKINLLSEKPNLPEYIQEENSKLNNTIRIKFNGLKLSDIGTIFKK